MRACEFIIETTTDSKELNDISAILAKYILNKSISINFLSNNNFVIKNINEVQQYFIQHNRNIINNTECTFWTALNTPSTNGFLKVYINRTEKLNFKGSFTPLPYVVEINWKYVQQYDENEQFHILYRIFRHELTHFFDYIKSKTKLFYRTIPDPNNKNNKIVIPRYKTSGIYYDKNPIEINARFQQALLEIEKYINDNTDLDHEKTIEDIIHTALFNENITKQFNYDINNKTYKKFFKKAYKYYDEKLRNK